MDNFEKMLPTQGWVEPTKDTKPGFNCLVEHYNDIGACVLTFSQPGGGFSCTLDNVPEFYLEALSREKDYLEEIEELEKRVEGMDSILFDIYSNAQKLDWKEIEKMAQSGLLKKLGEKNDFQNSPS